MTTKMLQLYFLAERMYKIVKCWNSKSQCANLLYDIVYKYSRLLVVFKFTVGNISLFEFYLIINNTPSSISAKYIFENINEKHILNS